MVEVARDTTWSGEVRVDGIVHVRRGAVLSIRPGTRVLFSSRRFSEGDEHEGFAGSGIRVEGRIVAVGTEEEPIVFSSATGRAAPALWDKIFFSFSGPNRFEHCIFEGARYAFHAHFSEISVSRSVFRENEEGVRLGGSRVRIADSVFTRNAVRGINFRQCRNEITGNLVYGNGDGVFLHSRTEASVVRGNAIYANRGYNLRLGDLHAGDVDVSGNWWGTPREEEVLRTIYDGRLLPEIGKARISPVLSRPPARGARIRGVFTFHLSPVEGAEVRALLSLEEGFAGEAVAAFARTDPDGAFVLLVPPGRYFVAGWAQSPAGMLFSFPGRNPVAVEYGETAEIGLPAVVAPPRAERGPARPKGAAVAVRVTADGEPVEGAVIQAFPPRAPDFRGAKEAAAVTGPDGRATLFLSPGRYHLAAKKRAKGAAAGMVEEGGLFGVFPHSPIDLPPGTTLSVEIPVFEKKGYLGTGEREPQGGPEGIFVEGTAYLGGLPAKGYIVYFYAAPEAVGRPAGRSSIVTADGKFGVTLPGPGDYLAYIRAAEEGAPAIAGEKRVGPVAVRAEARALRPAALSFHRGEREPAP